MHTIYIKITRTIPSLFDFIQIFYAITASEQEGIGKMIFDGSEVPFHSKEI